MKRIERLTGIITFLQSRNFTPLERLVEKFKVSERTLYRDLVSLHEIGVPISYERDRGYHILDTHFIPPVSFSEEEAVALTLAGRLLRRYADHLTLSHFDNALDKIKYALNDRQKDMVETITDSNKFHMLETGTDEENHLFAVQSAIIRKRIIKITYRSRKEETTEREIEPIGLTFYGDQWHTIAYCWTREAYRDFIVSSILELNQTALSFRKNDHLTLDQYIMGLLSSSGD